MEAAEDRMKELLPRKKKINQKPLNKKMINIAISEIGKAITGKAIASGKVKFPKE
jgi:hypothetical protein